MNAITFILFAQQTRGDLFREGFRSRGATGYDDVLLGLLIVATIVAGMWAISRLVSLRRQRRGYSHPWKLFWALCKAHQLNWSDSWLLRRCARDLGLREPGRIFLEAELWDGKNLGSRFALEAPRLKSLREQLFGGENQPRASTNRSARPGPPLPTPLFPSMPSPTLDIPPWTGSRGQGAGSRE
jgi:hypothetical protein